MEPPQPQGGPTYLRGDLETPKWQVTVFGHQLLCDAEHFSVAIASRWVDYDWDRTHLLEQGKTTEVLDLLFDIFAAALAPGNPDWPPERLRTTFHHLPVVEVRVLNAFFGAYLAWMPPPEVTPMRAQTLPRTGSD